MGKGITSSKGFLASLWLALLLLGTYRCFGPIHYDPGASAPVTEEAVRTGYFLYTQGDWTNPYWSLDTGPTAHSAPGFPALVAAVYRVFGNGPTGAYALEMTEATVLLIQIALLPAVMQALGTSLFTGLLAAFFAVLGVQRTPTWEANYVGLLLMVATLLACRYYRLIQLKRDSAGFLHSPLGVAWLLGGVWGVILLTGPSAVFVWLTWLVLGAWQSRRRGYLYTWVPALIVPLVLLVPWEWRNYKVFHAIIPVRTNFGLELGVSNSPTAKVTFHENFYHHYFPHPNADATEARKVLAAGEVKYSQQRMREAMQWIRTNPQQALGLWIRRFFVFWFPTPWRKIAVWTIDVATILSFWGLFLLGKTSRLGATLCLVFLFVYPPIYYIIQAFERYRFPILWVTFGLAAVACSAILQFSLKQMRVGVAHD